MDSLLTRVSSDQKLIQMWLHGRPSSTQEAYGRDVQHFLDFINKPLPQISLEHLQNYATYLHCQNYKERTITRKINAIKSLFSFATKLNYVRFNVAAALRLQKTEHTIAHRILPQREILKLINAAAPGRDRALLKLLYATGMRISEACGLNWQDFIERDDGEMQVAILGKGGKRRVVLLPASVWCEIEGLRNHSDMSTPVFRSTRSNRLDRTAAHRIIKAAALKAGINPKASAHWFRHANASHALARGASIALVKESLGHSSIAVTDVYIHANPKDSTGNYLGL